MGGGNHGTLVYRLARILMKLNQRERLDAYVLAEEFAHLPLQKENGRYHLDASLLGKLSNRDIKHFASLAGVRGLFPSLSDSFLHDILTRKVHYVIEQSFGTMKRILDFSRSSYFGLDRVHGQALRKLMCLNLIKAANMIVLNDGKGSIQPEVRLLEAA